MSTDVAPAGNPAEALPDLPLPAGKRRRARWARRTALALGLMLSLGLAWFAVQVLGALGAGAAGGCGGG